MKDLKDLGRGRSTLFLTTILAFLLSGAAHAQYCAAGATTCDEFISNVVVGSISNATGCGLVGGYSDYTAQSTNMTIGVGYGITVTNGNTAYATDEAGIWVDWNQDNDFLDANETIAVTGSPGVGPYTATITPPGGALAGNTRMRIRITYATAPTTCGTHSYGEVEDYTINVAGATPMAYSSSTTTQNTSNASKCAVNQQVVGLEIVTTGSSSPLSLTQLQMNMTGTSLTSDVTNIDVFCTGNSSTFATTTLFGTATPGGGTLTVNGSEALLSGTNYFWIAYDINPGAATSNTLDAQVTQITIGSNYTPSVSSPAGSRPIVACTAGPGGVTNALTAWIHADQDVYTDAGVTLATNGDIVNQWNNQASNPNVLSLTRNGGGNPTLSTNHANYNYNSVISFTADHFVASGLAHDDVLSNANGETMFFVGNQTDLSWEVTASPGSGTCGGNRCNSGFRGAVSQLASSSLAYGTSMVSATANYVGFTGSSGNSTHQNTLNGTTASNTAAGTRDEAITYQLAMGNFPGFSMSGMGAEGIAYAAEVSSTEFQRIESYLAVKYGITMGTNGTARNYLNAAETVIWDATANAGYNYDIAGVAREDASGLDQRKSHSVNMNGANFRDVLTAAIGSNFSSPAQNGTDRSYLMWGSDNAVINSTGVADYAAPLQCRVARTWKAQESGSVGTVTLQFDLDQVIGVGGTVGNNNLADVRLLVDADGTFAAGATAIAPSSFNNITNIVEFQHDFVSGTGFFFSLGSVDIGAAPLPVSMVDIYGECEDGNTVLHWATASEHNNQGFHIYRSEDGQNFENLAFVPGAGESQTLQAYQWTDEDAASEGRYYRLTQEDFDGHETVLNAPMASDCKPALSYEVFPNPFLSQLKIWQSGSIERAWLMDATGRIVKTQALQEGHNVLQFPASLAPGIYFLVLDEGSDRHVERVTHLSEY